MTESTQLEQNMIFTPRSTLATLSYKLEYVMSTNPLRPKVIALYKQLVYLGREYPAGYENFFRPKLKAAFMKKKDITDEQEILKSIKFGEYIIKEIEMMYYLRKYRTLRKRYNS